MKITQEADYAVRITYCLAKNGKTGAKSISDETGIPARFTLKILRKLMEGGIVESVMGAGGGYKLSKDPEQINVRGVIEIIDGPIVLNRCIGKEYECSRVDCKESCPFHMVFTSVNEVITEKLEKITLARVLKDGCSVVEIL